MAAKAARKPRVKREKNATPAGRRIELPPGTATTLVEAEVDGKMRTWILAGHHHPMSHVLRMNVKLKRDTDWIDGKGNPVTVPTSKMSGGKCRPGTAPTEAAHG